MVSLRTDSTLSRNIVTSFLEFLNTVEVAPGQDKEGIEVAAQCLIQVFGIQHHTLDEQTSRISLIDLFSSTGQVPGVQSARGNDRVPTRPIGESSHVNPAMPSVENSLQDKFEDEIDLQEKFKDGLELAGFFDGTVVGTLQYDEKLKQAKAVVEEARKKVRSTTPAPSWSKSYSEETLVLAEAFKIQGNTTMNSNQYHEAIQLYTLAISLCSNNAIFYSNRAAALTSIGKLEEAIGDCHAAMKLDPLYSKAYSRLGSVYFAQGKFEESIEKGYKKALELDPTSVSSQENLRAAQHKLEEQRKRQRQPQQGSPPEGSSPSNLSFPPDITNLFPSLINMASQMGRNMGQGQGGSRDGGNQPGGVGNDNNAQHEEPDVANFFPSLINMASQMGRNMGQGQGGGRDGGNQPGGVGNDNNAHQEEPDVANFFPSLINMASQMGRNMGQGQGGDRDGGNQPGGVGNDNNAHQEEPDVANLFPSLINIASQIGQRVAQSTQNAGQGAGREGGNHPSGVGNDNDAHHGEPDVMMDSFNVTVNGQEIPSEYASYMQNAFQQMFGGSGGWPPGTSSNSQQGPP